MQLNWLPALSLCLIGCQHQAAESQTRTAQVMLNLKRLETVIYTPTGTTRKIEFKNIITDKLIRIEIQHITTGRKILGETAVRADELGQWLLYNLADNKITTSFKLSTTQLNETCLTVPVTNAKTVFSADFVDNGTHWRAYITRIYDDLKALPGIATESESAIDLAVCDLSTE